MTHDEALAMQAGRQVGVTNVEHVARARAARAAVERWSTSVELPPSDTDPPPELASHLQEMGSDQGAARMLGDGWVPRMVDLGTVRAVQPVVFEDDAEDRVSSVDPWDVNALARLMMPVASKKPIPVAFNTERQAYVFTSANPNLRIQGNFQAEVAPGVTGFGFVVGLGQSLMQVACLDGRRILRDGYHRAYGLLRRGITRVSLLVKEFPSIESLDRHRECFLRRNGSETIRRICPTIWMTKSRRA